MEEVRNDEKRAFDFGAIMTLNEDIEFWEKASKHPGLQSKDFVLVAFGVAAGLRMAKHDHLTGFAQVFDFLQSIEGAGYGGMAEFEIARETMRRTSPLPPSHSDTP
jgi:hypothetical protein